jgi:hypothetical protein
MGSGPPSSGSAENGGNSIRRRRKPWIRIGRRARILCILCSLASWGALEAGRPAFAAAELPEEMPDGHLAKEEHVLKELPVEGAYTVIPLPAFSYNRNEGPWYGVLVPILRANPRGEIEDILAPLYLHNRHIGETFTLNYYGYRSNTIQYRAVASYSTEVERNFELSYKDTGVGAGRFILAAEGTWFKNAFARFFGFGNKTHEERETTYTSREGHVKLTAGLNLGSHASLLFTERYRDVRIEDGVITSLPQTKAFFNGVAGIGGAQILGHRLTYLYDSRDNVLTPTRGSYVAIYGEVTQNFIHDKPDRWLRYGLDARHSFPHAGGRMVFVARFWLEAVSGQEVPFYERPMLGGENTLRAFGLNRFIDDTALLVNFEERIRVLSKRFFDHAVELELSPFLDFGRVTTNWESARLRRFQINPGVGIRALARPNVVGRLDVGYGKDGANVFVGLDYPF